MVVLPVSSAGVQTGEHWFPTLPTVQPWQSLAGSIFGVFHIDDLESFRVVMPALQYVANDINSLNELFPPEPIMTAVHGCEKDAVCSQCRGGRARVTSYFAILYGCIGR
ncbi:MAG: hypothetical protein HW414_667 [Dehalococcoidia bacterium]|nr:hypothetical protein [Dehalococcoidia bacterium]